MYLIINGNKHTVFRRMATHDTVKYLSVSPAPAELTGTIQMYHNNGNLLSEDVCENYSRCFVTGSLVTLTNKPKAEPSPVQPTLEELMAQAIKEGVDSV